MKKNLLMSLVLMFTLFQAVLAQTRTVSGRVIDQTAGEGLPGVTVLLKGTTTGMSTNADGRYSLTVPDAGGTLVFSSIGMITQEIAIGNRSTVDAVLAADNKQLSEVVVTGYGQVESRRDLTSSIATVNSAQYKDQPVIGVDQALQGRAAGVQVFQNSGTPGAGIAVRVRGAASISASNEPLYVVDGLPINTTSTSQLGTGNQGTNGLNDLNPNDIATIEVLKDAASAAIYGSRASNGVVLITTKRGKSGKANVDLDYYTGVQSAWKRPQVLNGPQQTQLFLDEVAGAYVVNADGSVTVGSTSLANPAVPGTNVTVPVRYNSLAEATAYTFRATTGTRTATTAYNGTTPTAVNYAYVNNGAIRPLSQFQNPSTAPTTNWSDLVLRNAQISNYGVTFSGGSDASRYRLAVNYFDQLGTVLGSGYNRGSVRFTLDNKLSEKIRMGASIGINRSVNNRINNDNSIYGVLTTARLYGTDLPLYNTDGTYYKNGSLENPYVAATEPYIKSASNRLIGSQYTEFELIKNLRYRATFGLDFTYARDDRFYSTLTNAGASVNGQASQGTLQDANFNHISSLNYVKTFGTDHSLNALFVAEYQRDAESDNFATVSGFPSNAIHELAAGATKVTTTSSSTSNTLFGLLAKADYAFKGRYLLSASVRRDNSSRFGENNRVGYFPAFSAGWRIIDESFMKDQTVVTELKLRGSYGQTGNQPPANFGARGLIGVGYNYLDQGGLILSQLANPDLRWERTSATDLGLDLAFLQNRLYVSGDLYYRHTTDLLLQQSLTYDTGFTSYSANVGSLENKGLELALTTVNIQNEGGGFNWSTNFNISFNRNKVLDIANPSPTGLPQGFASRLQAGQPLGAFYGYVVDHIFQSQDEINALNSALRTKTGVATATYQSTATRPGDIMFRDLDGDGVITAADQQIIGSAQPKYYGGITNTFRYKGFDLNVLFQYNIGNQIYNTSRSYTEGMSTSYSADVTVLNRWTPTNTNTDIPRAVYGDPNNNNRTSTRFLEDGSYGRFKTITLGYALPASVISRLHARTLRVYVQAQNLVTFTKYKGLDPEVNTYGQGGGASTTTYNTALGTDFFTYPQSRTLTGGVTLGF
ncbi:MAG: SusC/RagA family TonB-linked outer membrane protein [Janthinobacterium lividum]